MLLRIRLALFAFVALTSACSFVPGYERQVSARTTAAPVAPQQSDAERKWAAFAAEHMERMRRIDGATPRARLPGYKFDRRWVEIKDPLVSRYTPGYRIFSDTHFTFALKNDGRITCIGETWPGREPYRSAPDFEVRSYSNFVARLQIKVEDERAAADMVRLNHVVLSNGYETESYWRSYELKATRRRNVWLVEYVFVGDPRSSVGMTPRWRVVVGRLNRVRSMARI